MSVRSEFLLVGGIVLVTGANRAFGRTSQRMVRAIGFQGVLAGLGAIPFRWFGWPYGAGGAYLSGPVFVV